MKRSLLVSSLLLATLGACSSGDGGGNGGDNSSEIPGTNVSDVNNTVQATGSPASVGANGPSDVAAPQFVEQAAMSDMYEISAGKIAQTKAHSPAIKKFAEQMIADHSATTAQLKKLLPDSGVAATPPAALDERHAKLIEDLQKAKPDEFDKVYLDQQTAAHREALGLMQSYGTHGDNPALKGFAAETTPKIQMHLDMVQMLDHGGADETKSAGSNDNG